MDVYLIPTTTSARYELYYEAPDGQVEEQATEGGFFDRIKGKFAATLREAEEWRHRRHEAQPEPQGVLARMRRKVMGFIVERVAEQRLLWQLRKATEVCACIPADVSEAEADILIRSRLKFDADHHRKWLWIDALLLISTAPLVVIPGPNLPGFYFTFQVVGHYLSWQGAKRGLTLAPWTFRQSADLAELRDVLALGPVQRTLRFHELAARLRLDHLPTFLEDVAAPPA